MQIAGNVALVTGGASGLGLATVSRLVDGGASVVIVDLPSSDGKVVADRFGDRAVFVPADVTDEAQVRGAVEATARLGQLRVVVNCAGIGYASRVVSKEGPFPLDQFNRVVQVNLVGTFNVIRLATSRIIESETVDEERGVLVNTASAAAFEGQIGQAAYSASKGGIVGMTLPIARDLASHQIRVNTIAPGLFHTPLFSRLGDDAIKALGEQVPHPKRLGRPEEFGDLVAHIVENPMLNGETIRLDGGIRMSPR
jgi:NAD(P)-dependent dehydrogenase (short-subunit alcohol dehydrogenase family)